MSGAYAATFLNILFTCQPSTAPGLQLETVLAILFFHTFGLLVIPQNLLGYEKLLSPIECFVLNILYLLWDIL